MVKEAQIVVPTNKGDYTIKWDGYSYSITRPNNQVLLKYPSTISKALYNIFVDAGVDSVSKEDAVSMKEFAERVDSTIKNMMRMRLETLELELKNKPHLRDRGKRTVVDSVDVNPLEEEDVEIVDDDDEDDI